MKATFLILSVTLMTAFSATALADPVFCPKTLQGWGDQGARALVRVAASDPQTGISDATSGPSSVVKFQSAGRTYYLVQAKGWAVGQEVSGVVTCDRASRRMVVLGLSYQSVRTHGVLGGPVLATQPHVDLTSDGLIRVPSSSGAGAGAAL